MSQFQKSRTDGQCIFRNRTVTNCDIKEADERITTEFSKPWFI